MTKKKKTTKSRGKAKQQPTPKPVRAAKPAPQRLYLHAEVLQNGASLSTARRLFGKSGNLALNVAASGELALPHYPLPNNRLEFLRTDKTGTYLVVDHKWDGFATSRGKLVEIPRGEKGQRVIRLEAGDYGAIGEGDLRILVKIAPLPPAEPRRLVGPDTRFRRNFFRHFIHNRLEGISAAIGAAAACVVVGGFLIGMMKRPNERPEKLAEIAPEYMLPFLAPDHLKTAPELMQDALDRKHLAQSVLLQYQSLTAVMMGYPGADPRYLLPTTIERYDHIFAIAKKAVEESVDRQAQADTEQLSRSGTGVMTIPAVVGESMTGSMLRIVDKLDIMHAGLEANLKIRRDMIEGFRKDPEYNWEEYRNVVSKSDRVADYLSNAKPWGKFTDEERMYAEAQELGVRANAKRNRISAHQSGRASLADVARDGPVGLAAGAKFASFRREPDFRLADEKLYLLQGSEYGARIPKGEPKVKEPVVGEIDPHLIEKYIKENRFQLQLCYELALRRNEAATGTMEWAWRIDTRGQISDLNLVQTDIKDQKMAACIRQKIATWRFPRPRRGAIEVRYPFEFAPTKG